MAARASHQDVARACGCAAKPADLPFVLFEFEVDDQSIDPTLTAVSVGYEQRAWRAEALARHVMDWVLDFALRPSERDSLSPGRAMEVMRRAVSATFGNGTDRGVPGEVLLHAICRQFYGTDTVITKVWFKTSDNDTYKGFDAVHCAHDPSDRLELWLGEAKFYKSIGPAIRSALGELEAHFESDYLRGEFAIIGDKIEESHPHADELRRLMHPNTTLDSVFSRIVVPVLLTYNSEATAQHDHSCAEYHEALEAEVRRAWTRFRAGLDLSLPIAIRLFLLPMDDKDRLLSAIDEELRGWR